MAKKKKKKGYGKVVGFCAVVGCIAALLWGAGQFGLGGGLLPWGQVNGGNGSGDGGYAQQNGQQEAPPVHIEPEEDTAAGEEVPPVLIIRVVRDTVYHGDRQISIDELMPLLEEISQPGDVWELYDDQAIVGTYETVIALMRDSGVEFIER